MIELGKQYRMITLEMGENGYHETVETVTFIEIDGNLAKTDRHTIINLTSPVLHSLTDVAAANADREAAHAAYMNREG